MTDDEIIELAQLVLAAEQSPDDQELAAKVKKIKCEGVDELLMRFANKMLQGKAYAIQTDNPETARRARSIATKLGVTPSRFEQSENDTVMLFEPPKRN